MKVTAFYGDSDWCRVHKAGCADIRRDQRQQGVDPGNFQPYTFDADSERQVIEEVASDFIFANDYTPWTDYIGQVSFAPCVDLPREGDAR